MTSSLGWKIHGLAVTYLQILLKHSPAQTEENIYKYLFVEDTVWYSNQAPPETFSVGIKYLVWSLAEQNLNCRCIKVAIRVRRQ